MAEHIRLTGTVAAIDDLDEAYLIRLDGQVRIIEWPYAYDIEAPYGADPIDEMGAEVGQRVAINLELPAGATA